MFERLKKLIIIGIVSISTISTNTVVFASDETISISDVLSIESQSQEIEFEQTETEAPETEAPETEAPEIEAPETEVPETEAPETEAPETEAPETEVPETEAPETEAPETEVPEKESETTPQSETPSDKDPASETDSISDDENLSESEQSLLEGIENSPYKTNDELIAHQNIISVPVKQDFRFTQIDAEKAMLKAGCCIYEDKNDQSRPVGKAETNCYVDIISDKTSEWIYVESGEVRGFVNEKDIFLGEAIDLIASRSPSSEKVRALVSSMYNSATCYTHTTAQNPLVEKVYGIAKDRTEIYDSEDPQDASVVGVLEDQSYLAFILAETDQCYFIESGDVRGFVPKEALADSNYSEIKVSQISEEAFSTATELIPPEENRACYFTLTSTRPADQGLAERNAIVKFACQFVGNPYVWGGTSLTNGADCSGFVQSVYANYGYSIPRVACDQALYGTQIPIQDAEPGDLIFYAKQGYVYHVSMYIGNGRVVQAYSSKAGIITSEIGPNAVWATKVIGN